MTDKTPSGSPQPQPVAEEVSYEIWIGDECAAMATSPQEASRYAAQYSQESSDKVEVLTVYSRKVSWDSALSAPAVEPVAVKEAPSDREIAQQIANELDRPLFKEDIEFVAKVRAALSEFLRPQYSDFGALVGYSLHPSHVDKFITAIAAPPASPAEQAATQAEAKKGNALPGRMGSCRHGVSLSKNCVACAEDWRAAPTVEDVRTTWWFNELQEFWESSPDPITGAVKTALNFISAASIAPTGAQPVGADTLTESQIEDCIDEANRLFNGRRQGPSGQQLTSYDDWKHWLARSVERALLSAHPQGAADRSVEAISDGEHAELARLRLLINAPHTADWFRGVELEAAHQVERWSADHDAGKAPEDWFWLLGYLGGKALASFKAGDQEKGLHHIVSSSAALLNWHRNVTGWSKAMRPGIDPAAMGTPAAAEPGKGEGS